MLFGFILLFMWLDSFECCCYSVVEFFLFPSLRSSFRSLILPLRTLPLPFLPPAVIWLKSTVLWATLPNFTFCVLCAHFSSSLLLGSVHCLRTITPHRVHRETYSYSFYAYVFPLFFFSSFAFSAWQLIPFKCGRMNTHREKERKREERDWGGEKETTFYFIFSKEKKTQKLHTIVKYKQHRATMIRRKEIIFHSRIYRRSWSDWANAKRF